jgi:hypothetical protein
MAIQSNQGDHLTTGQLGLFSVATVMLLFFAWTYLN